MTWRLGVTALWLVACAEPPRQGLVTLELEPAVRAQLSTIRVDAIDARGRPYGSSAELDLSAPYAQGGAPSFAALPGEDDILRLRVRGDASDGTRRIEQFAAAPLREEGVTPVSVVVRDACIGLIPCEEACLEDGASDLPGCKEETPEPPGADVDAGPACDLGTVLHCGECGSACNERNTDNAQCIEGGCVLTCTEPWGDCDGDQRSTGCETDLRSDADHCGRCGRKCTYGSCVEGQCDADCSAGAPPPREGAGVETVPAQWLVGQSVEVTKRSRLVAVGLHVVGSYDSATRVQVGLYSNRIGLDDSDEPDTFVAQTGSFHPSEIRDDPCQAGALEARFSLTQLIEPGRYWVFLIANDLLAVSNQPRIGTARFTSTHSRNYAAMLSMPSTPYPLKPVSFQPSLALYLVLTSP